MAASDSSSAPDASASPASGLLTRIASGAVYVGLFVVCLLLGTIPTAIFVALISFLCCYEFFQMAKIDGKMPNPLLGLGTAALFPIAALGDSVLMTALIFILMLASGLWYMYVPRIRMSDLAITVMGPLYTGFMLSSIVLMRDVVSGFAGAALTVAACASLWASDSLAYLVGRFLGRHKMAPRISPKKTWEGFAGGIVGCVIVWVILWRTEILDLSLPLAITCGALVSILGTFGDLIESRIKRGVGVKDSGTLIPGHGGMLDRCDSLIFGCITAQLILSIGGVL